MSLSALYPLGPQFGEENHSLHTYIGREVLQLAQRNKKLSESRVVSKKGLGCPRESFLLPCDGQCWCL